MGALVNFIPALVLAVPLILVGICAYRMSIDRHPRGGQIDG